MYVLTQLDFSPVSTSIPVSSLQRGVEGWDFHAYTYIYDALKVKYISNFSILKSIGLGLAAGLWTMQQIWLQQLITSAIQTKQKSCTTILPQDAYGSHILVLYDLHL